MNENDNAPAVSPPNDEKWWWTKDELDALIDDTFGNAPSHRTGKRKVRDAILERQQKQFAPAVSPVAPTARDLISRAEAVEALERELDARVTEYEEQVARDRDDNLANNYFGGRVYQAEECALLIKALPFAAPVSGQGHPISKEWLDELRWACYRALSTTSTMNDAEQSAANYGMRRLRDAILSAPPVAPSHEHEFGQWKSYTPDLRGGVIRERRFCPCGDYEFRDVAAPSVGELEWQFYPDNGHFFGVRHSWNIHVARDAESYGDGTKRIAPVKLEGSIYVGCESVAAAKSLANSLQRILSGAAE